MTSQARSGPLAGLRVVEMAAIGPVPFAGTMLASMGAEIVRVERPGKTFAETDVTAQGRAFVTLDLKDPADQARALDLIAAADLLLEGFRPGVMERLGLGPDKAFARNPALVYGRMTGWGQEGPLASAPGHDINYIAITGALHAIGTAERPTQPLNLVGDYGGGALYLVVGVLAALREAAATGRGQVVDAAMCDGALNLLLPYSMGRNTGGWVGEREQNLLDGGAHFYGSFECKDGKFFSLGAIEPQFYAEFRRLCGLEGPEWDAQMDKTAWPALREKIMERLAQRRLHRVIIDIALEERDGELLEAHAKGLDDGQREYLAGRLDVHQDLFEPAFVAKLIASLAVSSNGQVVFRHASVPPPARVRHAKYGVGDVVSHEGEGEERKLTIEFKTFGTKTILERFVKPVTD